MDNKHLKLSANLIVSALQKPASVFTKADIISYIIDNDILSIPLCARGHIVYGNLKIIDIIIFVQNITFF